MKRSARLTLSRPWRDGLILTTGLSLLVFGAGELWHSGLPEWAFVLSFITTWCLISLFWSNDRYIEGSNKVLAGIVDYNFEKLHQRILDLENQLEGQNQETDQTREADSA